MPSNPPSSASSVPIQPPNLATLRDAIPYDFAEIRPASGLIQMAVTFCAQPETSPVFYEWLRQLGVEECTREQFDRKLAIAEDWSTRLNRISEWLGL